MYIYIYIYINLSLLSNLSGLTHTVCPLTLLHSVLSISIMGVNVCEILTCVRYSRADVRIIYNYPVKINSLSLVKSLVGSH